MKYIAFKTEDEDCVITFPGGKGHLNHEQMAAALKLRRDDILGAGFFMEIAGRKFFTGESSTLGICSRGDEDKELYLEQCRRTL